MSSSLPRVSHCGEYTSRVEATSRTTDGRYPYAVFIAHHRAAAGSDARFLHAQLERALGVRCFLGGRDDGSDDGIRASAEGLARSRTLLLVQTAGVLSVPSVLLECYDAVTRGLPLVCVRLISEDVDAYDFDDARALLDDLPNELPVRASAEALAELAEGAAALGVDVHAVQMALAASLPQLISCDFNSSGTDNQVNAALRDIADGCATSSAATSGTRLEAVAALGARQHLAQQRRVVGVGLMQRGVGKSMAGPSTTDGPIGCPPRAANSGTKLTSPLGLVGGGIVGERRELRAGQARAARLGLRLHLAAAHLGGLGGALPSLTI